jgi:MFS family permease
MPPASIAGRLNRLPIVRTHRFATAIVGIGAFFDLFDIFLAGVLATVLTKEFMLGPVLLQSVLASGFLGMFVGAVGLGAFADRFGRRTAFLINLARGGVLEEAALIEALQSGGIAGAGIDVFSKQPLPADNPLWRMPNVIITPNIGGRSANFVEQTLTIVEPNMAAFLDDRLGDLRNVIAH